VAVSLGGWQTRGQFGDLFGGVNALFTGLAFAGLVFTILLQRKDLKIQSNELRLTREELKLTREELKNSTEAQRGTREALFKQLELLQLSATATVAANYMSQGNTMEQGGFRRELWDADREIRQWAKEEAGKPPGAEDALEIAMQSDRYIEKYPDPVFRTSFEAWVHARREHDRLVQKVEKMFGKLVEGTRQDALGGAGVDESI